MTEMEDFWLFPVKHHYRRTKVPVFGLNSTKSNPFLFPEKERSHHYGAALSGFATKGLTNTQ